MWFFFLFPEFESMLDTATRISELDHSMRSIRESASWIASDTYVFLLTRSGLLAAHPDFTGEDFYNLIVDLADLTYLMNYGQLTVQLVEQAVRPIAERFGTKFIKLLGEKKGTLKLHILVSHFHQLLLKFGAVHHFDSFILEFVLGQMIRMSSSRVNQMGQTAVNTLLIRFHPNFEGYWAQFSEATKAWMKKMGYGHAPQLSIFKITDAPRKIQAVPCHEFQELMAESELRDTLGPLRATNVKRVTKIHFGAMCLTSSRFCHKGRVNDSFVQVDGEHVGRISELFEITSPCADGPTFVLKLLHYDQVELQNSSAGDHVRFPVNQRPCKPSRPERFRYFVLTPKIFIQKAIVIMMKFSRPDDNVLINVNFISILPNQYSIR